MSVAIREWRFFTCNLTNAATNYTFHKIKALQRSSKIWNQIKHQLPQRLSLEQTITNL
jgi:hypothetical protein